MPKHAYLIIAHNQPRLLKLLCQMLDHENHDIYIHVNAEAKGFDFDEIKAAVKRSDVTFIPRAVVRWGGYSLVKCELELLKAAAAKKEYSYYHLLSGADLPLVSAQQLYEFFEAGNGKEYIDIQYGTDDKWDARMEKRIKYYYPLRDKFFARDNNIGLLEKKLVKLQQKLKVDRLKNIDRKIASGSQWFSITHDMAMYVLDSEPWVEKHFKYCGCGDEIFLQMLVRDTKFEKNIYKPTDRKSGNSRYIDWKRGNPYTFRQEDFELLINSGCMFARKFDIEKYPEICYKIYDYLADKVSNG